MLIKDTLCICQIAVHEAINKFTLHFDSAWYKVTSEFWKLSAISQQITCWAHSSEQWLVKAARALTTASSKCCSPLFF